MSGFSPTRFFHKPWKSYKLTAKVGGFTSMVSINNSRLNLAISVFEIQILELVGCKGFVLFVY